MCTGFGDYGRALPLYREILAESPQDAELHLSIAHALKTLGQTEEAVESYRAAAAARPYFGEAYWSLANLKTYRFTDAELDRMRADEASPEIRLVDRYHLCFALGKALEDRAEYAESFIYYERGNALKKTECRYKPEPLERNARLQAAVCTREFFDARRGFGCAERCAHFHRRLAAVGLDPDRADPGLPFPGGGHHGTGGYSAPGAGPSGPGNHPVGSAVSGRARPT